MSHGFLNGASHDVSVSANAFLRLYDGDRDPLKALIHTAQEAGLELVELSDRIVLGREVAEVKSLLASAGLRAPSFAVGNDFSDATASESHGADYTAGWTRYASELGAAKVRVFLGEPATSGPAAERRIGDAFETLCKDDDIASMSFVIETHGGLSSDPAFLSTVVERFGLDRVGVCLDWGRVPLGDDTFDQLLPLITHVHVKTIQFDQDGRELTFPIHTLVAKLAASGYEGLWVAEYEGAPPFETGTAQTIQLLCQARQAAKAASV